ncbi:MAG: sensor N-terminal transmembrane domain-containing protein [Robiginitomaculum sp.]|nr:sensor N-terminal transmembrane domain-containing protein [Robiginitomaculum sp.]
MAPANTFKLKFPKPRRRARGVRRFIMFSTLTRMIFLANLLGLIILIIGALTLNQFSRSLIDAKIDNLHSQTRMIANLLGGQATGVGATAVLDEVEARRIMARIDVPDKARIRLYDRNGALVADSDQLDDSVEVGTLAPITANLPKPEIKVAWWVQLQSWSDEWVNSWRVFRNNREKKQRFLERDIKAALLGETVSGEQYEGKKLIVAVAMPVKRVADIQGALVFETHDVDTILASQRQGLTPIILIAILAAILSSLALTLFIALPIRRLARAAEQVVRSSEKRDVIPDLSDRRDEIGDLSVVMRDMTGGLYNRIDDIAAFAADVAHEIKNPLTSLRSASETLRGSKTDERRNKLIDIIQKDVSRMDRLITDISKASRMDAALAKEKAQPLDLHQFLGDMVDFYTQTREETAVDVVLTTTHDEGDPVVIPALENSFGQVLRNLIDNALTFSPDGGTVRLAYVRGESAEAGMAIITVDDDGVGIPKDNLEEVFSRFYTQRPKGTAFGNHSGLGLAISRQIMDAHNGTITASNITNNDGKITGARFTLVLPVQIVEKDKTKSKAKHK